jgi:hypothetical protein
MLHQVFHQKPITSAFLARTPRRPSNEIRRNPVIACIEGRSTKAAPDITIAELASLQVEGILVPQQETDMITRTRALVGVREIDSDPYFILFDVRP